MKRSQNQFVTKICDVSNNIDTSKEIICDAIYFVTCTKSYYVFLHFQLDHISNCGIIFLKPKIVILLLYVMSQQKHICNHYDGVLTI